MINFVEIYLHLLLVHQIVFDIEDKLLYHYQHIIHLNILYNMYDHMEVNLQYTLEREKKQKKRNTYEVDQIDRDIMDLKFTL